MLSGKEWQSPPKTGDTACETYRCSNTLHCVTCHNAQRALEAWKESYLKARQPQKDAPDDNHESENGLEA